MKELIRKQIMGITEGLIFDTHVVVDSLIQSNTDEYLSNYTGGTTELYHGKIGQVIAGFETGDDKLVERVGESWSKNIRDKFSKCTCWKRV